MTARTAKDLLQTTFSRWNAHNAPRLGAALAYYTLLSMAPLVILLVAICALVLNKSSAEQQVLDQTRELIGAGAANALAGVIGNTQHKGTGILATVIAVVTLFFGASGVFLELRNALNMIWEVPAPTSSGVVTLIRERLAAFAMVASLGVFLLGSLLLSTAFGVMTKLAGGWVPVPDQIAAETLSFLVSFVALTVLFGLIYRFVPNVHVLWHDVAIGAVATAFLFTLGKLLLSFYLTTAGVGSAYGAAGSLVAFVVWVYYSAQIFFFGAEFTKTYADKTRLRKGPPKAGVAGGPKVLSRAQRA